MANAEYCEITGRWAQQARELIDIDYLLEVFNGQLQRWPSQYEVRKWHALAVKLGLVQETVRQRDMLLVMQHYIATTPPEQRCPCTRGVLLNTIQEHFPECEAVPALEVKAHQQAQLDGERIQIDLRRQRIEEKWLDNKRAVEHLQDTCYPAVLTHCPRVFLDDIKKAVEDEIMIR